MNGQGEKYDLEEGLIEFSVQIIQIVKHTPNTKSGNTLSSQLVRSGTSVALNYGEVHSTESRKDFVHKMAIVLKELRETLINMKILHRAKLFEKQEAIVNYLKEANELISFFVKSVETARKNISK